MSKATTLTLISDLGLSDVDGTETDRLYDDVVRELGYQEVVTAIGTVAVTAGTATYNPPTNTLEILEIENLQGIVDKMSIHSLQGIFGVMWRDQSGVPLMWTEDDQSDKAIRLVPNPDINDTLQVINVQYRTDLPSWLEMPIALEVLYREYIRESNHQDIEFAKLCRKMAKLWFTLVDIELM